MFSQSVWILPDEARTLKLRCVFGCEARVLIPSSVLVKVFIMLKVKAAVLFLSLGSGRKGKVRPMLNFLLIFRLLLLAGAVLLR